MEKSVVPVSQQLIKHIVEREGLLGKEFMEYQRQINVCDSMKDAFGLTGECKEFFKSIIEKLYNDEDIFFSRDNNNKINIFISDIYVKGINKKKLL